MKKIMAKILAVICVIAVIMQYVYTFWIRPFQIDPSAPVWLVLSFIAVLHIIMVVGCWLFAKMVDFITDNL